MSISETFHKALLWGLLFGGFTLVVACTESSHEEHENHSPVPADTSSVPDDSNEPCINTVQVSMCRRSERYGPLHGYRREGGHSAIYSFKPRFQLWSDGAEKSRWVYLRV